MRTFSFCALTVLFAVNAAAADPVAIAPLDPELGRAVDFYRDLFPVLEAKCLACHNVRTHESDLVLENVPAMLRGGASGPAVVPGKPEESLLYQLASHGTEPVMPPLVNTARAQPLQPRELGLLRQWITEGASPGNPPPPSAVRWQPVPSSIRSVQSVAIDPSSRFIAAGRANRVALFDLTEQRQIAELTDPALLSLTHDGVPLYGAGSSHRDLVQAVAFSPDGRLLASAGYREVTLWERTPASITAAWDAGAPLTALATASDGGLAATGRADGLIQLWSLSTGQPAGTLTGAAGAVRALAFAPDGLTLYSGGDEQLLRRWNVADGISAGQLPTAVATSALLVHPEGTQLLAAQQDHVVRVWETSAFTAEADTGAAPSPVREIRQHGQPVTSLVWLPGTDQFLSTCRDGNVRLIKAADGQQVRGYGLGSPVTDVAVSSDGQRIAATGENGVTKIWRQDGNQSAEIKVDPAHAAAVQLATDNQIVAKLQAGLRDEDQRTAEKDLKEREESLKKANEQQETAAKALAEPEKKLQEAEAKAVEALQTLEAKPDDEGLKKAKAAADKVKADAEQAVAKAREAVASAERGIKLSEAALARAKQVLETAQQDHAAAKTRLTAADETLKQAQSASPAATALRGVAFTPGGGQLATGGDAPHLDLWNGATGTFLERLPADGSTQFVRCTANGALVIAAGSRLTVMDARPQWRLSGRLGPSEAAPLDVSASPLVDRVLTLAFSPDGTQLATGGGDPSRSGELLLWDVASRSVVRTFTDAHSDTVFDLEFSRDGTRLVSGAADKFVKLWNVATGELVRSYEGHTGHVLAVAIKCDDSSLASGGADQAVKLWNLSTGEQRRTISNFQKQVTSLDYIGVTDNLVASGGDKTVRLFTASNGNNFRTYGGQTGFVYDAAASRDQALIVAAGEDGIVRVWNGQNGNELLKFDPSTDDRQAAAAAATQ